MQWGHANKHKQMKPRAATADAIIYVCLFWFMVMVFKLVSVRDERPMASDFHCISSISFACHDSANFGLIFLAKLLLL